MKDYTAAIAELSAAYQANRVANASISAEVKAKYRALAEAEIKERRFTADKAFADHLARVKTATEMPLTVIQEYVLHTKAWARWVYWRDLADIAPERVTMADAKAARAEANAPYRWDENEYNVLWWRVDNKGKLLEEPLRMEIVEHRPLAPDISYAHRMILREHLGNMNTFLDTVAGPIILERFPEQDNN